MKFALAALAFVGLAAAAPAGAVTILNSSFEQGITGRATGFRTGLTFGQLGTTAPGYNVYSGLQGWTTASGNRIEVHNSNSTALNAQDGSHFISLDGGRNSAIQQSVALGIGTYLLSFWYSPENGTAATNAVNYSLGSLLSGQARNGVNGAAVGNWTQIQVRFGVTTAGSYLLRFGAAGSQNRIGGFLDNVQIASVPVPAAGLTLIAGLGALAGLRRRRAR